METKTAKPMNRTEAQQMMDSLTSENERLWAEWEAMPHDARLEVARAVFCRCTGHFMDGHPMTAESFIGMWVRCMAETKRLYFSAPLRLCGDQQALPPEPDPKPSTAMPGVGSPVHADQFGNGGEPLANAERETRSAEQ